jgi:excisionase family DNA binding protein
MKATIKDVSDLPAMMTMADVQEFLGGSKAMAYRLANMGSFPSIRLGNAIRVRRERLMRWIDKNAGILEE